MAANRAVATYLKDHLAGSASGVSLARQIAEGSDDQAERREMEGIAGDIEADRRSLLALMKRLEVSPSLVKQAGAWIGEKIGRIKLNASNPDRRLLQYEAMIMGVTGKLELWRSLQHASNGDSTLNPEEVRALAKRAEDQRLRLEKLHDRAAAALTQD